MVIKPPSCPNRHPEGDTMTTDTPTTDTGEMAADLRNAAAWYRLAADALDAGDVEQAWRCADLGRFGCDGIVDRIRTLG